MSLLVCLHIAISSSLAVSCLSIGDVSDFDNSLLEAPRGRLSDSRRAGGVVTGTHRDAGRLASDTFTLAQTIKSF